MRTGKIRRFVILYYLNRIVKYKDGPYLFSCQSTSAIARNQVSLAFSFLSLICMHISMYVNFSKVFVFHGNIARLYSRCCIWNRGQFLFYPTPVLHSSRFTCRVGSLPVSKPYSEASHFFTLRCSHEASPIRYLCLPVMLNLGYRASSCSCIHIRSKLQNFVFGV